VFSWLCSKHFITCRLGCLDGFAVERHPTVPCVSSPSHFSWECWRPLHSPDHASKAVRTALSPSAKFFVSLWSPSCRTQCSTLCFSVCLFLFLFASLQGFMIRNLIFQYLYFNSPVTNLWKPFQPVLSRRNSGFI